MAEHVDISTSNIHIAHNYVYADATAREAASLLSADIGKIAKQTDNSSFWVLANNTGPVWIRISVGSVVNPQTGTSYTILAKDRGKLVTHTNGSAIAVTLPQASSTGFGADWMYWTQNRGAGAVTITPTTSTIDGASTLVLNQNEGALIISDGTNYFTFRGKVSASGLSASLTVDTINAPLFASDAGANDTYTASLSPAPSGYTTGNLYRFKANTKNTGAATINFNSLGAKTIKKYINGTSADLDDNDIQAGQWVSVVYDGTNMVLVSPVANAGYLDIPQNSQSAAYTTVMSDRGKHLYHPSADTTARTFTIDSNANVPYPIGTSITFINDTSGGVITIAITSDTLVLAGAGTTGSRSLAANGVATAIKVTSTRWIISGTGLT